MLGIGLWAFWVVWLIYMIGNRIELSNLERWANMPDDEYDLLSGVERRQLQNTLRAYDTYE